jgi:O-antigen/teichoic acid export membrane protein
VLNKEVENKFISGGRVAKNTAYNLLGYGIPIIVAVVVIPQLIKGLGEERFGILNLVWIVIGYFSFFDFGIGRTLTKIVAEKIGSNQLDEIPSIFWTSFFIMLVVSIIASLLLIILTPILVSDVFIISEYLQQESLSTFYLLSISIPIVTTTAGLRGVLEAYQDFGVINVIRILLGVLTFLGPLVSLIFINSMFWIVIVLIVIRIGVWILYLLQCFKINPAINKEIKFSPGLISPILKLGGWITVANLIAPFMIFSDRFLIGALVSATAVTYYATPYEVVTKLLLIPGALVVVLFPVFSASYNNNPEFSKKLFKSGTKFIFLILYPAILLIVTFSFEGIELWLGIKFAENSSLVLQLLAVGVLLNSLAAVPFNFFQGIGKPNVPALVNLVELPFYLVTIWLVIKQWGINGAALIWLIRIVIDTVILFFIAQKEVKIYRGVNYKILMTIFLLFSLTLPFIINDIMIKIIYVMVILAGYVVISWKYLLVADEKSYMLSILKKVGNYS